MRWTILLLIIISIGCAKTETHQYLQEKFANISTPGYTKCKIGELNYFTDEMFIYHANAAGTELVYSPVGEYMKSPHSEGWQLRIYKDKNNSAFNKTWSYILNRRLPNGEDVICEKTGNLPAVFVDFIKSHEALFKDFKQEVINFD